MLGRYATLRAMKILSIILILSINNFFPLNNTTKSNLVEHNPLANEQETTLIDSGKIIRKKDISDPNNKLTGKIETLELQYVVWGCACANWVKVGKYEEYQNNGILSIKTIFIEPAEKKLELPKNFDPFKHKIVVKGQFYIKPDYPKGTPETEEILKKAPVFRYTSITIKKL